MRISLPSAKDSITTIIAKHKYAKHFITNLVTEKAKMETSDMVCDSKNWVLKTVKLLAVSNLRRHFCKVKYSENVVFNA